MFLPYKLAINLTTIVNKFSVLFLKSKDVKIIYIFDLYAYR